MFIKFISESLSDLCLNNTEFVTIHGTGVFNSQTSSYGRENSRGLTNVKFPAMSRGSGRAYSLNWLVHNVDFSSDTTIVLAEL